MDLRPGAINRMPRGPYPPDARERWKNLHRARRIFRRDQDRLVAVLGKIPPGPLRDRAIEKLLYPPIIVDPLLPGA